MEAEQRIIEAVAKVAKRKPAEIRLYSSFEDLGMDSLESIELAPCDCIRLTSISCDHVRLLS